MALGTTMGAALLAGVAGGATAAAATQHEVPASTAAGPMRTTTAPAGRMPAPGTRKPQASGAAELAGGAAEVNDGAAELTDARTAGAIPAMTADGIPAVAAKRQRRPAVRRAVETPRTGTAWVHPNPAATVTSCFGPRGGRQHDGVDLAAPHGTPIVAAGTGNVVRAGVDGGYGNAVLVDHGNGYLTHYGHLSAITVAAGQRVVAGQQIGNEGSTGHSTGPHLHFEVHQGHYQNPVEPTRWMHEHGVDIPGCAGF